MPNATKIVFVLAYNIYPPLYNFYEFELYDDAYFSTSWFVYDPLW